jgi:hypothetical protein
MHWPVGNWITWGNGSNWITWGNGANCIGSADPVAQPRPTEPA